MLLTQDHEMIRDAVRDFAKQELWPNAARWDREHIFPREAHQGLAGTLDNLFRNFLHLRHLFVRRVETAVGVQVADDADRRIDQFTVDRAHVKLPFEMFCQ